MLQGDLDAMTVHHDERIDQRINAPRIFLQTGHKSGTRLEIAPGVPVEPGRTAVLAHARVQPHPRAGAEQVVVLVAEGSVIEKNFRLHFRLRVSD